MRIPQLQSQVSEAQTPSVRIQGGISPGEAVQMANNQSKDLLAVADTYMQYQDQTDRVRVMDAQNKLAELKLRLQTDQKDGYANKKGVDVVGFDDGEGGNFIDYYQRQYVDGIGQISSTLSNDRQRKMFGELAQKESTQFKGGLQSYFLRENDNYQQSVYSASADRYVRNISEDPLNFGAVDENRKNLKAAYYQKVKLEGGSATEADNAYIRTMATTHANTINAFIENGALKEAVLYKKNYQSELAPLDDARLNQRILKKLEDKQVEVLTNQVTLGTQPNSSPYGAPPQASKEMAFELKNLPPNQAKNLKYNDPRISAYVSLVASERNMEDLIPLIEGLRLAGEKSNNDQVSEAGAKSFMQFIPSTWHGAKDSKNGYKWDRKTGRERDINNPADVVEASFDFISDIAKKYKTRDPMVIAAYYHGGDEDARLVLAGKQPKGPRGRAYLERLDKWINGGFDKYYSTPLRTREQAYTAIQKMDAPLEVKERVQASVDKQFAAQDRVKKEKQDQVYDQYHTAILNKRMSFEQIPVTDLSVLTDAQFKSLRSFSDSLYKPKKESDGITLSSLMIDKDVLLKGQPRSVLHKFAKDLTPVEMKEAVRLYDDVNKAPKDLKKNDLLDITPNNVANALQPYLPMLGITNKSNKNQIEHYSAVQSDMMQALREAEAGNGGKLSKEQFNRIVLKNVGIKSKITTQREVFGVAIPGTISNSLDRIYAVKSKDDIAHNTQRKIDDIFKKQGRDLSKVTLSEYLNAYYSMTRRGF